MYEVHVRHTLTSYLQSSQDSPHLVGRSYELFVRTLCPSVLAHIKYTALAGLVKSLDLGHIVHNSTKATTARKACFERIVCEVLTLRSSRLAWASQVISEGLRRPTV
jgi:hypothetical protein